MRWVVEIAPAGAPTRVFFAAAPAVAGGFLDLLVAFCAGAGGGLRLLLLGRRRRGVARAHNTGAHGGRRGVGRGVGAGWEGKIARGC